MIAPKGPGHLLRRTYEEGSGMPCLVAVEKDLNDNTKDLALSYASACLLYTSPSPRDATLSRMPSSA